MVMIPVLHMGVAKQVLLAAGDDGSAIVALVLDTRASMPRALRSYGNVIKGLSHVRDDGAESFDHMVPGCLANRTENRLNECTRKGLKLGWPCVNTCN